MTIEEGTQAPEFDLQDQDGNNHKLSELLKQYNYVVFYAYPKAMTPGCTTQAKDFTCLKGEFEALNAKIVGISADSVARQKKFEEKESLDVTLLSDEKRTALEAYGFYGEKKMYGRVSMGIIRSTAVITKDGKVLKLWRNVRTKNHAQKVLDFIKAQ